MRIFSAHLLRAFVVFSFPSFCFADGISVTNQVLGDYRIVLLAKVLALDVLRHLAKVKVVKVYRQSVGDAKSTYETNGEYMVELRQPTEARAGKWVEERVYWDAAPAGKVGETVFLISTDQSFESVTYSEAKAKKIDLYFDTAKLQSALKKASLETLTDWQADQDLMASAIEELERRNAFTPRFLLHQVPSEQIMTVGRAYLQKKTLDQKIAFYDGCRNVLAEGKVSAASTAKFLGLYQQYSGERLSPKKDFELFARLSGAVPELQYGIGLFHSEFRSRIEAGDVAGLARLAQQSIDTHATAKQGYPVPSCLVFSYFFVHLKGDERRDFIRSLAKKFVELGPEHYNANHFFEVFEKLKEQPDLGAALTLSKADYTTSPTNIKVQMLEAVLKSRLQFEDMENPKMRKALLDFADKYIDPKIPAYLSPELTKRLQALRN